MNLSTQSQACLPEELATSEMGEIPAALMFYVWDAACGQRQPARSKPLRNPERISEDI